LIGVALERGYGNYGLRKTPSRPNENTITEI